MPDIRSGQRDNLFNAWGEEMSVMSAKWCSFAILTISYLGLTDAASAEPAGKDFTPVIADKGGDSSSGGDTRSAHWVSATKKLSALLRAMAKNGEIDLKEIDFDKLDRAIERTKVSFTDEEIWVEENGRKVRKEARNFPKRKPPLIEFNTVDLDAIPSLARRAAHQIHEYISVMNGDLEPGDPGFIDDRNYQISSRIEDNPSIKFFAENLDEFRPANDSKEAQVTVTCKLYDHGKLVRGALGRVGPWGRIGGQNYQASSFIGRRVRETEKGPLMVTVDSLSDPLINILNNSKTQVKGPVIRVSVGYGESFMGPPPKLITQTDVRAFGVVDATVDVPFEEISVRCRNVTKQDLIDESKAFLPEPCERPEAALSREPVPAVALEVMEGVREYLNLDSKPRTKQNPTQANERLGGV